MIILRRIRVPVGQGQLSIQRKDLIDADARNSRREGWPECSIANNFGEMQGEEGENVSDLGDLSDKSFVATKCPEPGIFDRYNYYEKSKIRWSGDVSYLFHFLTYMEDSAS